MEKKHMFVLVLKKKNDLSTDLPTDVVTEFYWKRFWTVSFQVDVQSRTS